MAFCEIPFMFTHLVLIIRLSQYESHLVDHSVLNSESLAETAKRIAKESGGNISCKILGKKECEARGMGSFLGVARGSETDPQFIHLTYKPKSGEVNKKVAVVGKGLLFDTGGYNIKTAMMELMKFDCGGSAATLGAARAVGELAPEGVEAHFIVAACENMINERAVVPSDILTASNGKTIEIINTDAEGRLTLADALVYADKEVGAESIIEMSTLTGAMMVSLGKEICGFFTTDDALAKELEDASKKTGDKVSQEQFLLCDYFHCYLSRGFPSDTCFFPIILFTTSELENAHGKGIQ